MLNIPVEIKEKLKTNTATKNFRVTFPNGERADIINDHIVFESVHFTESVMSQDKFKLGLCESPVIEFEAFNIENIKGKKIECYYEIYCDSTVEDAVYREDLDAYVYPIPLGVFYVDSCKKEAKMNIRRVIAYGLQAYFKWELPSDVYPQRVYLDITDYVAMILQSEALLKNVTVYSPTGTESISTTQEIYVYIYTVTEPQEKKYVFIRKKIGEPITLPKFSNSRSSYRPLTGVQMTYAPVHVFGERLMFQLGMNSPLMHLSKLNKEQDDKKIVDKTVAYLNNFKPEKYWEAFIGGDYVDVENITGFRYPSGGRPYKRIVNYLYTKAKDTTYALDGKYKIYSDINVANLIPIGEHSYIWSDDESRYITFDTWTRSVKDLIALIDADTNPADFSIARNGLVSVWETYFNLPFVSDGLIYDSGWVNGEENRAELISYITHSTQSKTIDTSNPPSEDEVRSYVEDTIETLGKFGRFDRDGIFELFTIDTDTLVPNDTDLVPSESLVPNGADVDTIYPSEYETAWYDDELSLPYGACAANHKVSGTDTYTIVYADGYDADSDPSTYQIYDISNNDLIKEMTVERITPILTTIITNISNLRYMPSDIDMVGRPDIEAGDGIQVMSSSGAFNTYVLSRTTDGIQGLSDTITAK